MKIYLYILCFILGLSNCCIKSDSINQQTRDTVIYYNNHQQIYMNAGYVWNYYFPIVDYIDSNLIININFRTTNFYLYDTFYNTTLNIPLFDSPSLRKAFVENFINTYCNHWPLTANDYTIIKKIIAYTFFMEFIYGKYSYTVKKRYYKLRHIVDTCYVEDVDTQSYSFVLVDTICDIRMKSILEFKNDKYIYNIDNDPISQLYDKLNPHNITSYSFNEL